ncbi:MAG: hypothetical protein IJA71_07455 [Clostridia bacterium]|nr:hypothetical protein [Clostridia bacterium]
MAHIAVIDTETNWADAVMSVGAVIADGTSFAPVEKRYLVLDPEFRVGGMFDGALCLGAPGTVVSGRREAMAELKRLFSAYGVRDLFAYNACFDRSHLPELRGYAWYDIMRIAAYRQTNPAIPQWAECCSTGRLKRGYGVEPMLRLLSGKSSYQETHNALDDALDELRIMKLLGRPCRDYIAL